MSGLVGHTEYRSFEEAPYNNVLFKQFFSFTFRSTAFALFALGKTPASVSAVFKELAQHPPHTLFDMWNLFFDHP